MYCKVIFDISNGVSIEMDYHWVGCCGLTGPQTVSDIKVNIVLIVPFLSLLKTNHQDQCPCNNVKEFKIHYLKYTPCALFLHTKSSKHATFGIAHWIIYANKYYRVNLLSTTAVNAKKI